MKLSKCLILLNFRKPGLIKAKGKRKIYLEFNGKQFSNTELEKEVYMHLKDNYDIKYSSNIDMYVNFHEGMVYSVVDGVTYKLDIRYLNL